MTLAPEVSARMLRDAEWQATHGNPKGALTIYRRLFAVAGGHSLIEAFARYRALHQTVHRSDLPHREVFDFVYRANIWGVGHGGGAVPDSGMGSLDEVTAPYREFLAAFMRDRAIASVVDIGCGDWRIGRLIDWTGIDYVGIDVSSVIMENTRQFAAPHVRFVEGDAREIELPPADLVLAKDVFQHWSNDDIRRFLPKLNAFRYALVTDGADPSDATEINRDVLAGGHRRVDLSRGPFHVPGTFVFSYDLSVPVPNRPPQQERKRVFLIEKGA